MCTCLYFIDILVTGPAAMRGFAVQCLIATIVDCIKKVVRYPNALHLPLQL